jgi:hypothetical protein
MMRECYTRLRKFPHQKWPCEHTVWPISTPPSATMPLHPCLPLVQGLTPPPSPPDLFQCHRSAYWDVYAELFGRESVHGLREAVLGSLGVGQDRASAPSTYSPDTQPYGLTPDNWTAIAKDQVGSRRG